MDAKRLHLHHRHLTGYVFTAFCRRRLAVQDLARPDRLRKEETRQLTYGSTGTGSSLHLGMEMLAEKSGVKFIHVPFKGAVEVNAAVAGGHVMLGAAGTSVRPLVDAGKARLLNIWTAQRVKSLPDIPTLL